MNQKLPRGRQADSPRDIPRRGWWDVLSRVRARLVRDDVGLVSAGVAFYLFLSVFPALAALISIYALFADPAQVSGQLEALSLLPGDARELLEEQLTGEAGKSDGTLGWTFAGSLLVALWAGSKGMKAMMRAMNIAYGEREERGFVHRALLALAFTGAAVLLAAVACFAIGVVPVLFELGGLGAAGRWVAAGASWVVLVLAFVTALAAVYRWAPCRADARWRWISPGAGLAAFLWLLTSGLFSLYVSQFGSYDKTYGSLASVVILFLWLWISSGVALLGAELNAETEHQTTRDSTTGEPAALGERGAHVADTVGEARG